MVQLSTFDMGSIPTSARKHSRAGLTELPVGDWAGLLMIGSVVAGFCRFRARVLDSHSTHPATSILPRRMHGYLEGLYREYAHRSTDAYQLEAHIENAVGDDAENHAFVGFCFWGAVLQARPRRKFARALKLNRHQLDRATLLYKMRHDRIDRAMRKTEARLQWLLSAPFFSLDSVIPTASSRAGSPRSAIDLLKESGRLTREEVMTLRVTLALLRRDVEAAHHWARNRFLGTLSRGQRELLDIIENAQRLS